MSEKGKISPSFVSYLDIFRSYRIDFPETRVFLSDQLFIQPPVIDPEKQERIVRLAAATTIYARRCDDRSI